MVKLTNEVISVLRTFNLRKLEKYEKFLFAKAISEIVPLPPIGETGNIRNYVLYKSNFIIDVISTLSGYVTISQTDKDEIHNLIINLVTWRSSIAHGNGPVTLIKNEDCIDYDVSSLSYYIDSVYLADLAHNAIHCSYQHTFFRNYVSLFSTES